MRLSEVWMNILLPFFTILIPVFATIYSAYSRIRNENRENHKPYLILEEVKSLTKLDKYKYYFLMVGKNYDEEHKNLNIEDLMDDSNDIAVELILKNIGYGVATNIKFYNLYDGKQLQGTQELSENLNQKLFTTFDIASGDQRAKQAKIVSLVTDQLKEDYNRILCVYKDLNNNIYSFIISIVVKKDKHYDFFTYQPSSKSYKNWINYNKKSYKKIMSEYKK